MLGALPVSRVGDAGCANDVVAVALSPLSCVVPKSVDAFVIVFGENSFGELLAKILPFLLLVIEGTEPLDDCTVGETGCGTVLIGGKAGGKAGGGALALDIEVSADACPSKWSTSEATLIASASGIDGELDELEELDEGTGVGDEELIAGCGGLGGTGIWRCGCWLVLLTLILIDGWGNKFVGDDDRGDVGGVGNAGLFADCLKAFA
jgi:hypothetical protein